MDLLTMMQPQKRKELKDYSQEEINNIKSKYKNYDEAWDAGDTEAVKYYEAVDRNSMLTNNKKAQERDNKKAQEKIDELKAKAEERKYNKKIQDKTNKKIEKLENKQKEKEELTKDLLNTDNLEPTKPTTKSSTADASKDIAFNISSEDFAKLQFEKPELFKIAGMEDKSPEDINPKEMADKMTSDKRFWELIEKEKKEGRLSRIATVVSAIITAASGGRVPFIPFNAITGADQQMAYLRKAVGVYTDQAAKDAANVNTEKSQEEIDKLKANPKTIKTAKEATKTDVARKGNVEEQSQLMEKQKEYDKFLADLDVDKRRLLADIDKQLEELRSKLRINESKEMMKYANTLEVELAQTIIDAGFTLEEINKISQLKSALGGRTNLDAFFDHLDSASRSVGNVVGAAKK